MILICLANFLTYSSFKPDYYQNKMQVFHFKHTIMIVYILYHLAYKDSINVFFYGFICINIIVFFIRSSNKVLKQSYLLKIISLKLNVLRVFK